MAKEFKTLNVTTANEERTIRVFQTFGWTLKNNQEIYVKDSHSEVRGNQRYSVTETTHYVKLSFERDGSKLKYFSQLRQLENAFYAISEPQKPRQMDMVGMKAGYILFGFVAILLLVFRSALIIIPIACIAFLIYRHRMYNDKMKAWQAAYNKCWKKRERILAQAEPYLE